MKKNLCLQCKLLCCGLALNVNLGVDGGKGVVHCCWMSCRAVFMYQSLHSPLGVFIFGSSVPKIFFLPAHPLS